MWTLVLTIFVIGYNGEPLDPVHGFDSYGKCMKEGKEWLAQTKQTQEYDVFFTADYDCQMLA